MKTVLESLCFFRMWKQSRHASLVTAILILIYFAGLVYGALILPAFFIGAVGGVFTTLAAICLGDGGGMVVGVVSALAVLLSNYLFGLEVAPPAVFSGIILYLGIGYGVGQVVDLLRKQRDELLESAQRLDLALSGGQQGLWDWDVTTGKVYRDDRYLAMLGYQREEMEDSLDGFTSVVHPEDIPDLMNALQNHLKENTSYYEAEYRARSKSGDWIWMVDRGKVVSKDRLGNPLRVVGTAQNVSERKRILAELALEREWLAVTLRSIGDAVIATDKQGRIALLNRVAEELTGWAQTEAAGQPLSKVLHIVDENTGERVPDPVKMVLATGEVQTLGQDTVLKARDGSRYHVADSAAPIKNDSGDIIGVVVVFRDVTERKEMEAALRRREETYRNLFHNAQVGLFRSTVDGRLLEANDQFARMFGYRSREEVLDIPSAEVLYADVDQRREMIGRIQRDGEIRNYEAEMLREDGTRIWVQYSAQLTKDGNCIEGVMEDITERKEALEALKTSEQRYRYLYEHSPVGLITWDARGHRIKEVNSNIIRLFRNTVHQLGSPISDSFRSTLDQLDNAGVASSSMSTGELRELSAAIYPLFEDELERAKEEGREFVQEKHCACERDIWIRCRINPLKDKDGNVGEVMVACEDITAFKEVESRIRYLSFHDKLTDLYNRAYFEEELKRLNVKRQLPISIICGDVNGLKLVNDAFGHQDGDRFLVEIANILRSVCRKEDIIARWGGDEFVILLPRTSRRDAERICNRIRSACKHSDWKPVKPSIALGSATKEAASKSIRAVIRSAEERMYRNKLGESTSARSAIINSLTETLREKSCETEEHAERLRKHALRLGQQLGLSESALDELVVLAALHDLGKIAIPDEILSKPEKLTKQEWKKVCEHPEVGYRIARASSDLSPIAEAILSHHERWDGKGYPRGLKGHEIPLASRIIAVIDAYDAMVSPRPYRDPVTPEEALRELERCAGTQFDPEVTRSFVAMIREELASDDND